MNPREHDLVRDPGRFASLFDDRWNPILVKEVRQSLRGKFFRVGFALMLLALTIASIVMIIAMGAQLSTGEGRDYVLGVFVCLAVAVLGLVPYATFSAMGAEWEENTFDLLIISNLRPRQIVMGKLLSAGTQTLLYYSAFTPFMVFAFLLRGVDLLVVLLMLVGAFVLSVGLSCVALMLSTLTRIKFLRLGFMAFLTALLVAAINLTALGSEELLRHPGNIREDEFILGFSFFLLAVGVVSSFCFLIACNMLSHPEENRSTGLRILTIVTGVLVMSLITYGSTSGMRPDREQLTIFGIILTIATSLPMIFFTTEPDRLGRRVAPRVPRNPLLALLVAPFMPGGGRGLVLYFLELCAILTFIVAGHVSLRTGRESLLGHGVLALVVLMAYLIVFIGLPSRVMASHAESMRVRIVTRAWIPALVLLSTFLPALIGFFIHDDALSELRHSGNPAYLMSMLWAAPAAAPPALWITLVTLLGLTLLLNLPRLYFAFAEVWRASAARVAGDREREAARDPEAIERAVAQP